MADFEDQIKSQSSGAFARTERQGLRFFLERAIGRERFKSALFRYLAWLTPALGAAVAITQLYAALFNQGH